MADDLFLKLYDHLAWVYARTMRAIAGGARGGARRLMRLRWTVMAAS